MSCSSPAHIVSLAACKDGGRQRSLGGRTRALAIGDVVLNLPDTENRPAFVGNNALPSCTTDQMQGLSLLPFPAWVFDIEALRMIWANDRAVRLWQAPCAEVLCQRNFDADMTAATASRLRAYETRLAIGEVITEQWTFYPAGKATAVMCTCSGIRLEDGRTAMLVIGQPLAKEHDWSLLRGIEALRHIGVMVSLYDLHGHPLVRNPAALEAYPGEAHVFGQYFVDPSMSGRIAASLAQGEVYSGEAEVETAAGRRWHALQVRLTVDPANGLQVMLVNEQDVTDRIAAEERVATALHEAQEANRSKSDFLTTMSHELRTPLNAIIGFSRMIAEEQFGPLESTEYRSFAEDIVSSSEHLLDLINDILDYARLETKRYKVELQPVELARELERCIAMMRPLAEEADVALLHEIPEPLPVILADRRALRQIVINLVSNGIKFTPAGGRVTVGVDFDADAIRVHISDTGIGMDATDLPEVVKPFRQLGSVLSREAKGTGLGLAICTALIDLHQGRLDLTSELGVGSRATVYLPRTMDLAAVFAREAVLEEA